jgi:hypothetical protein
VDGNGAKALIGREKFHILIAKSLRARQGEIQLSAISDQQSAFKREREIWGN